MSDQQKGENIVRQKLTRRSTLAALAMTVSGGTAGFLGGRKVSKQERSRNLEQHENQSAIPGSDRLRENATTVDGWYVTVTPYLRVVDTLAVATGGEKEDGKVPDSHFESVEADDEHQFVIVYGEGYRADESEESGQAPPSSKWALDVWVPDQQLSPWVVERPELKWYRLPEGVEGDRYLPAYPNNLFGGGYMCFEAESPGGTVELLFSPNSDDMKVKVPKAGARWKYLVEDGNDE